MIGRFSSQAVEGSINRISDLGRGAKCRLANADEDSMDKLRGHSITYRIAVGPQQGRKVFTLQTLRYNPVHPQCKGEERPAGS